MWIYTVYCKEFFLFLLGTILFHKRLQILFIPAHTSKCVFLNFTQNSHSIVLESPSLTAFQIFTIFSCRHMTLFFPHYKHFARWVFQKYLRWNIFLQYSSQYQYCWKDLSNGIRKTSEFNCRFSSMHTFSKANTGILTMHAWIIINFVKWKKKILALQLSIGY